jgi:hypothetical protein
MRIAPACAGGLLFALLLGGTAIASAQDGRMTRPRAEHLTLDTGDPWGLAPAPGVATDGAIPRAKVEFDRADPWSTPAPAAAPPVAHPKIELDRNDPWTPAPLEYWL